MGERGREPQATWQREREGQILLCCFSVKFIETGRLKKKGVKSLSGTHSESQSDVSKQVFFFCSCANLKGDLKNTQLRKFFSVGS